MGKKAGFFKSIKNALQTMLGQVPKILNTGGKIAQIASLPLRLIPGVGGAIGTGVGIAGKLAQGIGKGLGALSNNTDSTPRQKIEKVNGTFIDVNTGKPLTYSDFGSRLHAAKNAASGTSSNTGLNTDFADTFDSISDVLDSKPQPFQAISDNSSWAADYFNIKPGIHNNFEMRKPLLDQPDFIEKLSKLNQQNQYKRPRGIYPSEKDKEFMKNFGRRPLQKPSYLQPLKYGRWPQNVPRSYRRYDPHWITPKPRPRAFQDNIGIKKFNEGNSSTTTKRSNYYDTW